MSRSTIGFHFRAVGSNPRAAQVAGISPAGPPSWSSPSRAPWWASPVRCTCWAPSVV
ncbi:hypothetical protein [Brachybacterium sp. Z12]|uniref:hypothetical protein n=1 Tax=Brachybacterium sp. Z12 TaxID=2759167 RepID=UPI00223ACBA0|nr:hypothetical protein [Brachybacterium sp. Z12]